MRLSNEIVADSVKKGIIGARGKPPETFSTLLMALLPDYFTAVTGSPQISVIAQIRGLFGLSEDTAAVKDLAAQIRKKYRALETTEHPLILIDKLFRP